MPAGIEYYSATKIMKYWYTQQHGYTLRIDKNYHFSPQGGGKKKTYPNTQAKTLPQISGHLQVS